MESKKLKAKDLINVGIYTAIYLVIFFVVGMLNAIPVLYPFLYILIPADLRHSVHAVPDENG